MNATITYQDKGKYKENVSKLESLLLQLNQLSVKRYEYVYKYGEKHYLYYRIANQRFMFRYADRIEELIKIVEILVRYRMIEYEAENEW